MQPEPYPPTVTPGALSKVERARYTRAGPAERANLLLDAKRRIVQHDTDRFEFRPRLTAGQPVHWLHCGHPGCGAWTRSPCWPVTPAELEAFDGQVWYCRDHDPDNERREGRREAWRRGLPWPKAALRPSGETRVCEGCDRPFVATRGDARFHDDACRKRASRARRTTTPLLRRRVRRSAL